MKITEPSTMITDYVLGAFAVGTAIALARGSSRQVSRRFWIGALLFTGVAALIGGTNHGFRALMAPAPLAFLWTLTLAAIGSATFCFLSATAWAVLQQGWRRVVVTTAAVQYVLYLAWIARHPDFRYAVYNYAPAMLMVLVLHAVYYVRLRQASARWIIAGIVVSFAAAAVQMAGWGFHTHFNHNDVYHMIQMIGVYCFYQGGRALVDRS